MRGTDHPTDSIPPAVTDRILTWPSENSTGEDRVTTGPSTIRDDRDLPPALDLPFGPDPVDRPLPPIRDIWLPSAEFAAQMPPMRPSAATATAALVISMVSMPLALVGVGAVTGMVAVILGVVALIQISAGRRRAPEPNRYRGTGRAATAIVAGIGSVVVGTPILLVILMVLAVL